MNKKIKWTQVAIVIAMILLLTALLLLELHLFINKALPKMEEWKNDSKKTWAWILENLAYFLPAATLCAANSLLYRKKPSRRTHHMKALIAGGSTVLSYVGALLRIRELKATVWAEALATYEPGKLLDAIPALGYSYVWLLRAAIPLVLIISYHLIRAASPDVEKTFCVEDSDTAIDESKYQDFADEV